MKNNLQTYEIKITLEVDVDKSGHPRDWIKEALEEGHWNYKIEKIYGTDITPLDKEDPIHKWIKDFK